MLSFLLSVAAAATSSVAAAPTTSVEVSRPDRMICERIEELGSRLNSKKVCMMRSQWQAQRDANKLDIDKAQTQQNLAPGK